MLSHNWKGNRPSVIKPDQREVLRLKLLEPGNGLRGFTELLAWFNEQFNEEVKYSTMNKFVKRNYEAQCKMAHKSHVKKDPAAIIPTRQEGEKGVEMVNELGVTTLDLSLGTVANWV